MNRGAHAIGWAAILLAGGAGAEAAPVGHLASDDQALAGQPLTELPPPPAWIASASDPLWAVADLQGAIQADSSKPPPINHVRDSFVRPDQRWLVQYIAWFRKLQKPLNIHYEDEVFDCDKFARCFVAFADLLARKGGESRGSICVGWATVFNDQPFAGIQTGGAHAVVICETTAGLFVIEPQNGEMVSFADYPNRNSMVAIYL